MGACASADQMRQTAPTIQQRRKPGYHPKYTSGPHAYSNRDVCRRIEVAKSGMASVEPTTVAAMFKTAVKLYGPLPVLKKERVDPNPRSVEGAEDDAWKRSAPVSEWEESWTYQEYFDDCKKAAAGFIALGMERHDAVSIYGFNAPEWHMGCLGAILGGGVVAGIYPSDTPAQVEFKVRHSGAPVMLVENKRKMEAILAMAGNGGLPKLKGIVVWEEDDIVDTQIAVEARPIVCMKWSSLLRAGLDHLDEVEERIRNTRPGHCCAYIYTSGTTGNPKAVMVSNDNIIFSAANACSNIPMVSANGERIISYLPLSHVAGMMVDIVCPLVMRPKAAKGCCVHFARPYDLKIGTIGERLKAVKPTIFLGVPRVWEKIMEKMQATIKADPPKGLKKTVALWGKDINLDYQRSHQLGGTGKRRCMQFVGDKVAKTVRSKLGLEHCSYAFTGAAPIKVETLEYFAALGININEVYGMSECTGATTWSTDEAHMWGSCGWAIEGAEVTIRDDETHAEVRTGIEGEVCFRGRHIMLGYMANPDLGEEHVLEIKAKNAEAIGSDGWLHSGDKGKVDRAGMVRITGRYKELIIGAGGENVAPVPVEDGVKSRCALISNVMMVGDKQKFNVAFITLKAVGATGELAGGDELDMACNHYDPACTTISGAMLSGKIIKAVEAAIVATNNDPACCPMAPSRIQRFCFLPRDFSVATEELTPTFKLKRAVVQNKYQHMVDVLYSEAGEKKTYVHYVSATELNAVRTDSKPHLITA